MTPTPSTILQFRTSSRCSKGNCVEVAPLPEGGAAVRDTKDRSQRPLVLAVDGWTGFLAAVKNGEFDSATTVIPDI